MTDTPKTMPLKKITVKTVFGDKGDILEKVMSDKTIKHPLIRVMGYCTSVRHSTSREKSQDGEFIKSTGLVGEIEAVNLETGEAFISGVCWLPQLAIDLVAGKLEGDEEISRVGFAFDISAKFSLDSATSYEYIVEPLLEIKESDAMSELKKALPSIAPPKQIEST